MRRYLRSTTLLGGAAVSLALVHWAGPAFARNVRVYPINQAGASITSATGANVCLGYSATAVQLGPQAVGSGGIATFTGVSDTQRVYINVVATGVGSAQVVVDPGTSPIEQLVTVPGDPRYPVPASCGGTGGPVDKVQVVSFTVDPLQPQIGQQARVTLRGRNLTNSQLVLECQILLGTVRLAGGDCVAPAGATFDRSITWNVMTAGTHQFFGKLDPLNVLGETTTGTQNNSRQLSVTVTAAAAPPPAPLLTAPADGFTRVSRVGSVNVSWSYMGNVTHYKICLSRPGVQCETADSEVCQVPQPQHGLHPAWYYTQHRMLVPLEFSGQRINWTMAACNQQGCGPWATPRAMTVTWTERPSRVPRCRAAAAQPPPPSVTTFATALHAKFQNARCVNCHHFKAPGGLGSTTHATRPPVCSSCHTVQGWRAPETNMDWSGRTAQQTCQMIKTFRPTAQSMSTHLKTDLLILWAINSGALPGGASLPLVPGGQAQWFSQVDSWINGGMLCN